MPSHRTTAATTTTTTTTVITANKLNDWQQGSQTIRATFANRPSRSHGMQAVKKIYSSLLSRPFGTSHIEGAAAAAAPPTTTTAATTTTARMAKHTRLRRIRRTSAGSGHNISDKSPADEDAGQHSNSTKSHERTQAANVGDIDNNNKDNLPTPFGPAKVAAAAATPAVPAGTRRRRNRCSWWHLGCRNYHPMAYVALLPLLLLLFATTSSLSAASPCDANHWWDPVRDRCILCTSCQGEMIPLRPCQLHRDTICGSIYDLKIDWVVLAKTEPNWKERRKDDGMADYGIEHLQAHQLQHLTQEQLQQLHDEALPLDWQTGALFFAVLACLLFFIVAAGILIHHMRQWRRMERRLDQDVEELSTKLMAKLAEVQSLEGGTFFIGNADALRIPTSTAFQPQHVLLPAEKPVKHHQRRVLKTLHPGNVYIEENGSKG